MWATAHSLAGTRGQDSCDEEWLHPCSNSWLFLLGESIFDVPSKNQPFVYFLLEIIIHIYNHVEAMKYSARNCSDFHEIVNVWVLVASVLNVRLLVSPLLN